MDGQVTVTETGETQALGSELINGPLAIKALDSNSGIVLIRGKYQSGGGLQLAAGQMVVLEHIGNLESLCLDAAAGDGVSWTVLN